MGWWAAAMAAGWMIGLPALGPQAGAATNVFLTGMPDYSWSYGCFATAAGNLMGYWDRHGCPGFYTGPTAGGAAPMDNFGPNTGIRSLWASEAGFDGRPDGPPGHVDDYWVAYESVAPDPHASAGRAAHASDCLGDFIGASQNRWDDLNGECRGNIDAHAFVFWDHAGDRRANFTPRGAAGEIIPDIPSGLRAFTRWRGSQADVFSQLADFNPAIPPGRGFGFEDLRAEIDAGYPVLLLMQRFDELYRDLPGFPRANPSGHAMVAYGYYVSDLGERFVRYRTSWASGDQRFSPWTADWWMPGNLNMPLRGVVGYHPQPRVTGIEIAPPHLTIRWEGPDSELHDVDRNQARRLHAYLLEWSDTVSPARFVEVAGPTFERELTVELPSAAAAWFRVRIDSPRQAAH